MADYRLCNDAREDLIRIHQYGVRKFGMRQADRNFQAFFECFDRIATNPYHYETVDYIRPGYRRCVCGVDSIYFRINNSMVEIISIIGRQDIDQIIK
jgi:toxin ParE1/3/4